MQYILYTLQKKEAHKYFDIQCLLPSTIPMYNLFFFSKSLACIHLYVLAVICCYSYDNDVRLQQSSLRRVHMTASLVVVIESVAFVVFYAFFFFFPSLNLTHFSKRNTQSGLSDLVCIGFSKRSLYFNEHTYKVCDYVFQKNLGVSFIT